MPNRKEIIQALLPYHLSKILPKNTLVNVPLKNGLKVYLRSRTADRMILKEIFIQEIYQKHGIEVENGDTVFDIGANIGIFSLYAAQKSTTGKVFSFEPFGENYSMLLKQIAINNLSTIIPFNKGVSNKNGSQDLFLSAINTGGHSLQFEQAAGKVTIETITLTDFCKEHQIENIDFLKIDCEGSEFDIIKHDTNMLNKIKKIVMECHPYGSETVDSMIAILEAHGFTVIREACNHENIEMIYAKKSII